jgi:hypothetical protein
MRARLRTLRLAAWLGWQLETNWASPWLFALYMLVKPVCGSLMLVSTFYTADQAAHHSGRSASRSGWWPLSAKLPLVTHLGNAMNLFKDQLADRHPFCEPNSKRARVPDFEPDRATRRG